MLSGQSEDRSFSPPQLSGVKGKHKKIAPEEVSGGVKVFVKL